MKKALALVLAVVLAFGMAAVSFAADADAAVDGIGEAVVLNDENQVVSVKEWNDGVVDPETPVYFMLLKGDKLVSVDDASVKVNASSVKGLEGTFSLVNVKVDDGTAEGVKATAVKFVCADPYLAEEIEATLKVVVSGKNTIVDGTEKSIESKVVFSNPWVEATDDLAADKVVVTFPKDQYDADAVYTLWYGNGTNAYVKVQPNGQDNVYMEMKNVVDKDLVKADPSNNFLFYQVVGNPQFNRDAVLGIKADKDLIVYSVSVKDDKTVYTKVDAKYVDGFYEITGKTFGSYVLATKEIKGGSNSGNTNNPNTGANDVVGVAAVFAVVSLAAAGAVAFKKASK